MHQRQAGHTDSQGDNTERGKQLAGGACRRLPVATAGSFSQPGTASGRGAGEPRPSAHQPSPGPRHTHRRAARSGSPRRGRSTLSAGPLGCWSVCPPCCSQATSVDGPLVFCSVKKPCGNPACGRAVRGCGWVRPRFPGRDAPDSLCPSLPPQLTSSPEIST